MTETLCVSNVGKLAAGTNVSTALTAANYTTFINQAEGDLAVDTGIDWVDKFSSISSNVNKVLEGAVAAKAAASAIKFDMSGFTSRAEAIMMTNVNWAIYEKAVQDLKQDRAKTLLGVT